jgi:hypothetical protein
MGLIRRYGLQVSATAAHPSHACHPPRLPTGPPVATGPALPLPTQAPPPGPRSPASGMAARNRGLNSIPPSPAMQPDVNLGYTTPPQNPAWASTLATACPPRTALSATTPDPPCHWEAPALVPLPVRQHPEAHRDPRGPAGSGGCTLMPDAHLFTVIDRAIEAELSCCRSGSRFEINEKRRVT